jgi:hypothetical protein
MDYEHTTRAGTLALGPDGICRMEYRPKVEVTIEDAREVIAKFKEICEGKRLPAFIDSKKLKSISRDARHYFASDEVAACVSALAIIVGTPVSKVFGNCFLAVKNRKVPTRLFTSDDAALAWLKGFVE